MHKLWSSWGYCSLHNELSNNRGLCNLRWEAAIFYPATCKKGQGRHLLQNFHRRLVHSFALTAAQCLCLVLAQQGCQRRQQQAPRTVPLAPPKDIGLAREKASPALLWTTSACCWLPSVPVQQFCWGCDCKHGHCNTSQEHISPKCSSNICLLQLNILAWNLHISLFLFSPIQAAAVIMGGWFMTHLTSTQILSTPSPACKSEHKLLLIYLD